MPEPTEREKAQRVVAENRKAHFDYQIERRLEAGIALRGTEIKSLRAGHANLRDGYARVEKGEVWLRNVHIAPWANSAHDNHDPLRPRKLLLHRNQIDELLGKTKAKGLTLVPLRLFRSRNVSIANVVGVLWAASMFAWFFLSALYLQLVLHYSPLQTGLGFLPLTAALFAASQLSARPSASHSTRAPSIRTPLSGSTNSASFECGRSSSAGSSTCITTT